jgi:hypothetical protein
MSDEDYRGLSQAELVYRCGLLEIQLSCAKRQTEKITNYSILQFRRVPDPAASEATTEDARAPPAPAPVAGGSGQPVQAPALPGPSVRRSAPRSRDREPGMERSAHTRTLAYGDRATCTPIMYVSLPSYGIDVLTCHI